MRSIPAMCVVLASFTFFCLADRPGSPAGRLAAADAKDESPKSENAPKVIKATVIRAAAVAGESKETGEKKEADATQKMVQTAQEAYEKQQREMQDRLSKDPLWQPAYEQVSVIKVNELAANRDVSSFCLNNDGNLLVCCGPKTATFLGLTVGKPASGGGIVRFSPDGKLLGEWKVDERPQVICVAADGTIFAGGAGKLLKLDQDGKVLCSVDAPNMADLPEVPKVEKKAKATGPEAEAAEQAKKDEIAKLQKQQAEDLQQYQKIAQEAAKDLKPNDDASMADYQAKLAAPIAKLSQTQTRLSELLMTPEMLAAQIQARRDQMSTITGMAITEKDVFIACMAAKGYGYVVWRTDHDFANPKKVVENLAGCCGQMDVQAHGGDLWVAHNARHKVEHYSRDGKKIAAFGKTDRIAADGFGGCCEPKNLRFGPEEVVFACESGPPTCVKRFSLDGKFLGVAVMAPWNSGCVRVTTEYDAQKDRFFVLNAGERTIHAFGKKPAAKAVPATASLKVDQSAN